MEETRLGQPVEALGIFIVDADVVGERVAPCPHMRGRHREIECAFLPLQRLAQFALVRCILGRVGRVIGSAICATPSRRRPKCARHRQIVALHDLQMRAIQLVRAVAAHADHAPAANSLLDQPFVFLKIRPLILRYPGAVPVRPETRVTKPERVLFALQEPAHELMGPKLLARCVPFVAVCDFDLLVALALVQIGHCRAQCGARLFRIKRLARHPEASFVVLESGLEIRHQHIAQLVARPKKVGQMAAPPEGEGRFVGRTETRAALQFIVAGGSDEPEFRVHGSDFPWPLEGVGSPAQSRCGRHGSRRNSLLPMIWTRRLRASQRQGKAPDDTRSRPDRPSSKVVRRRVTSRCRLAEFTRALPGHCLQVAGRSCVRPERAAPSRTIGTILDRTHCCIVVLVPPARLRCP